MANGIATRDAALVLGILLATYASAPAFAATCGTLAAVKDKVEVLRTQTAGVRYAITGKNFMTLECDDIIQTSPTGSAKLVLGDDKIAVAPDSRVEIASFSGAQTKPKVDILNLTYGKMRGLIKPRKVEGKNPKGAFRVRTFSAVVGVRGTDLFASYDPNAGVTDQAVIEGQVEVTQTGTNQTVVVEAGQQVSVETSSKEKPLKVIPIRESLKKDMRIASAIAKDDSEFAAPSAILVLGKPQTWTIEREDVPSKLKEIENEF
jgi:hypothetical protein